MLALTPSPAARCLLVLAIYSVLAHAVQADDIDIYLENRQHSDAPRVQLTIDYHPDLFAPLCRYAQSCRPPFMTEAAYRALDDRAAGEEVSRFEALIAVLEVLFADPEYAEVRLALLVSNYSDEGVGDQTGASLLSGYRRLGDQGSDLLAVLKSIPPLTVPARAHLLQPRYALLEWHRYLNGGPVLHGTATESNFGGGEPGHDRSILSTDGQRYRPPLVDTQSCPRLYSILIAMEPIRESDGEGHLLRREFGAAIGNSFADFWRYLHLPDVDLVRSVAGPQPLSGSWLLLGPQSRLRAPEFSQPGSPVAVIDVSRPVSLQAGLADALGDTVSVSAINGVPMIAPSPVAAIAALTAVFCTVFFHHVRPSVGRVISRN